MKPYDQKILRFFSDVIGRKNGKFDTKTKKLCVAYSTFSESAYNGDANKEPGSLIEFSAVKVERKQKKGITLLCGLFNQVVMFFLRFRLAVRCGFLLHPSS